MAIPAQQLIFYLITRNLIVSYLWFYFSIYKMSDRAISLHADTSATLYALIKLGHRFCELLIKRTQIIVFSNEI